MKIQDLKSSPNSRPSKTRKARGIAAGKGKTAGRGMNGQNSRSGGGVRPGFEGGQMPWFRRLPKRGFKNVNHIEYQIVNLSTLNAAYKANEVVDNKSLHAKKIISKLDQPVKILGNGEITKKLKINVAKISQPALKKIEAKNRSKA